jgi:hypothetical protein
LRKLKYTVASLRTKVRLRLMPRTVPSSSG